jgi:hypothetical protein
MMQPQGLRRVAIFAVGALTPLSLTACPDIPEECGMNVADVIRLEFSGPSTIQTTQDYDFAGYDVSVSIAKEDAALPGLICFAVRDNDPWTKGPWAVDDVLDANIILLEPGVTTRTLEGHFVLWAKNDDDICGGGALPGSFKVEGCSGESEAEVYIHSLGVDGRSSEHTISLE